jgi:hypothetical protein
MTKTATDTTDVDAEYRALALAASKGDKGASTKLMALEDRQDAMARAERRQAAAALEVDRLAVEAAKKATVDARAVDERAHATFLQQREDVFASIEAKTAELAREVALCLAVDQELWAASLRLGWNPEQRTSSRLTNWIASQLGRDQAGLGDMAAVHGILREAHLVSRPAKES